METGVGRHIPQRMCAVCRVRHAKRDLARFVLYEGQPEPDPRQALPGRGIYVCAKPECRERFGKNKAFRRMRKGGLND